MRRALGVALALACSACALFLPTPDDATRFAAWQRQAVSLRGLEFKRAVEMRWMTRAETQQVIEFEAGDELEPARVARQRDAYAALGALAPDVDLRKELLTLYASQVAGLYSLKRNTLFVSDEMQGKLKSLVLDPIVVHELVHALQDQNFPQLLAFLRNLEGEDDLASAFSGAIEGDASVTMLGAFPGARRDHDPRNTEFALQLRDAMLKELDDPDSEVGRAPRLLAVDLVFPYAYGIVASAEGFERAGNAGLDARLTDPPLATLHLLYPETLGPVEFVRLPLESLGASAAADGCSLEEDNVAGALVLLVLFEKQVTPEALAPLVKGWRGDRYAKLDCGARWELIWLTRWESRAAAERFADAYRALAPDVAASTKLSGPVEVVVQDKSALAVTPGLRARAGELLAASQVQSYADFKAWIAGGCFPASKCPATDSRTAER